MVGNKELWKIVYVDAGREEDVSNSEITNTYMIKKKKQDTSRKRTRFRGIAVMSFLEYKYIRIYYHSFQRYSRSDQSNTVPTL